MQQCIYYLFFLVYVANKVGHKIDPIWLHMLLFLFCNACFQNVAEKACINTLKMQIMHSTVWVFLLLCLCVIGPIYSSAGVNKWSYECSCWWCETISLNCGHQWANFHSPDDIWEWRATVEWYWWESQRMRRKTCPIAILSITDHTWTDSDVNPGPTVRCQWLTIWAMAQHLIICN
jgi:hypothetical protein